MRRQGAGFNRWAKKLASVLLALPLLALARPDPQLAFLTDSPDPVPAGGIYTYTLRADNDAPDPALNTNIRFSVPLGATLQEPLPANCTATSATVVECSLGTLGALGQDPRILTFRWRANGPGPTTVQAEARITAQDDANPNNNVQGATTTVVPGANLALTATGTPNPVAGGTQIRYTFQGTNLIGPNASGAVVMTVNLSPQVAFVSANNPGWLCSAAGSVVTCTRSGPDAVGASLPPVVVVGTVLASSGAVTSSATLLPAAPAAGGVADPVLDDNGATVTTQVVAGADVRILSKALSPNPVAPVVAGSNATFIVRPRNAGPSDALNVTVTDPLPAGWTYVSASGPNWSCSAAGQLVTCTRAVLPPTAVDDITIVARAPAAVPPGGASYTNTARIASTTPDGDTTNNEASTPINVLPGGADLSLTKTKTPDPAPVGALITSTFRVFNNGPLAATGPLRVVDVLTNEEYVGFSGDGWSCTHNAGVVVCDHPAVFVAPEAALPLLTITTRALAPGVASNTACTGGSVPPGAGGVTPRPPVQGDPNPANDCSTRTITVSGQAPDLGISKVTSTPTGGDKVVSASEGSVTYTIVVTNLSATVGATGVRIVDSVPGFIPGKTTFVRPQSTTVTVSGGTATFACDISTAQVLCQQNGGVLSPGQTATLRITVNRPLEAGTFTNTASVSNVTEGETDTTNNTASDTVTIVPIADVEMTAKTVNPTAVRAGERATYVFTYRNNGPSVAENVVVRDAFAFAPGDAGLTVLSIASTKPGSTCSVAPGAQLLPGPTSSFTCSVGQLQVGEVQTVTLEVRPNSQDSNPVRSVTNTASITTTSAESASGSDNGNNSQSATLAIQPAQVDLLVNKIDQRDPVTWSPPNTNLDYRVQVSNVGPSFGTDVRIDETMQPPTLPAPGKRVRFVCDTTAFGSGVCNSPSLCTPSALNTTSPQGLPLPTFTCRVPAGTAATGPGVGELAVGATKEIYLRFQAVDVPEAAGDVFVNTVVARGREPDPQPNNNREVEQTTTRQVINIRVEKTANAAQVAVGQPFTWTVRVTNDGPGAALAADLVDKLPPEVELTGTPTFDAPSTGPGQSCRLDTPAVGSFTCPLGRLNARETATVTVPVRAKSLPSGGSVTNVASVDTSDIDKVGGIDQNPADNSASSTVAVLAGSLSGTVFEDRDRAGPNGGTPQAAGTEPRLPGVSVRLTGTDALGALVDRTVTTDANGNYRFDALVPSNAAGYTITQTQPAGFVNGPVNPPVPATGGTYAAGGNSGNSSYSGIVLALGVAGVEYNFPELRRVSLSGFVYVDLNGNGVRDAATDGAAPGATVRLLDAGTLALVATAATDPTGAYAFTNLDPLRPYTLEQPLPAVPANLVNGPVNPGLVGGVPCAVGCTALPNTPVPDTDRIAAIDLSSGNDGTQFNFGELQRAPISGTVYIDRDRDGALDPTPGDGRIAGVTLTLHAGGSCAAPALATTTTDADGNYRFLAGSAGLTYTVCEVQPAGYGEGAINPGTNGTAAPPNAITITALPLAGSAGNHFGERVGSLTGSVYLDDNNDGARQGTEAGIGGVTVTLTGITAAGGNVSRSVTTDASGGFRFDDLLAGTYAVTEQLAQPVVGGVTTLNGRTTAGSSGGIATAVAVTPSAISTIALGAAVDATSYLFGEVLPVSIAGTVFLDFDNDGLKDPEDTGIGGVALVVTGTDDTGASVTRNVTTAPDGSYSVPGLRPGTYTVTEPNQPAGTVNGITTAGTAGGTATPVTTTPSAISGIPLATPGTNSSGNNFAEQPQRATISGTVYVDRDGDGTLDPTPADGRVPGVTLTLYPGNSCSGTPVATTTTDANGNYTFPNVIAGRTYTVCETQPTGYGEGAINPGTNGTATPPNAITIASLPATGSSANNFGERLGSLAGGVYLDANNDGVRQAGEPGIAGVTVTLGGTDATGATVTRTATTDANGNYRFGDLLGGTYAVTEQAAQPVVNGTTTLNGRTTAGTAGGTATAVTATPSAVTAIALAPGVDATAYNFGEVLPVSIAGTVFIDFDNDGLKDPEDTGLAGVPLTVTGTNDLGQPVTLNTTTGADGSYSVPGLRPGTYTVTEPNQPAGTVNGITTAGTAGGTATPVTTTPSAISGIPLATPGTNSTGNNFAEQPQRATISGTVYVDRDGDGNLDPTPTDGRVPGASLTLYPGNSCSGTPVATTTTDANGNYTFPNVIAGRTYTVCETQPTGYGEGAINPGTNGTATPPNAITIASLPATGSSANNFGERLGSLAGGVYLDANNDGVRQAGETGIAGVTVTLGGTDATGATVTRTATTDANGNYRFGDLLGGTYAVTEQVAQPVVGGTTTLNGRTTAGTAGGTATAVTSTPSAVTAIALAPGVDATAYNFGEVLPVSIAGTVFIDFDNDGLKDPEDTGLAGVPLTVTGTNDLGQPVTLNTTTGADGSYSVPGLRPGTYTVTEPNQPAGTVNGITTAGTAGGTATPVTTTPSAISGIPLATPGTNSTGNNFAEQPQRATISGTVYIDRDGDGTLDPTPADGRVPGVTLTLYPGNSCSGTPVATTTTDANGNYTFPNVIAGRTYTICETQPVGYGDGGTNPGTNGTSTTPNAITVTNLPATGSVNNQFAERVGSLAGGVYLDANNDGVRQAGETGIAGVTVTLGGTDATGATVTRTATTDASGNYRFGDLLGGTYAVTEQAAQPVVNGTTTLNGRTTAGTAGGTATAVTATPSAISAIALPAGNAATAYNFGEVLPTSVSGNVFVDFDNDGLKDPEDTGIGGVALVVTGTDDTGASVTRNVTTAPDGSYSVPGLRPGTYTVTEPNQPAGTVNGITTAGTAGGTATPVTTTPSAISGIPLTTPGTNSSGNNFAEQPQRAPISGTVYIDRDADGQPDPTPTDGRLPGVTLTLYPGNSCSGTPVATTTTDANGNYTFANVIAGQTYTICQTQPVGYGNGGTNPGPNGTSNTPNAITVTNLPATGSTNNQFGERVGSLAGGVYLDANNDGVRQAGETGIAGVTVTLGGTDATGATVTRTATTDANGNYRFGDLLGGTYAVTEQAAQPVVSGTTTLNGRTTAGTAGGTATAVTATPSAISTIALPAGNAATAYNFGEVLPTSVSGNVFVDFDNDGLKDPEDTGIGGVALVVTGTDDTGASVTRNVTTAPDGSYSVPGLRPGTYTVTEPNQPAGTVNGITTAGTAGGTATPVTTTPSAISGIPLTTPGTNSSGNNFAEQPQRAPISGTVYIDRDADGQPDPTPTDGRLPGVTLTLYPGNSCSGTPVATTTTDANGNYTFANVIAGQTYTICQTQPVGYGNGGTNPGPNGTSNTPNAITVTNLPATGSTNNQFGERVGSLAGGVYLDANNDGVRQAGETGIAGVTVTLGGTDATGATVTRTATTDASGNYRFGDLLGGTYAVTEQAAQPVVGGTTTLNGRTTAGTAGGTATAVTATPSAITAIALPAGNAATAYNFAEILPVGLSGTVFGDNDNDGRQESGEPGLPNVPLVITGTDDTGATVTRNVTTGPDGSYAVTDLRPGTYTVTQPTQPAGTLNGITSPGSAGGTATPVTTTPSAVSGIPLTTPGTGSTGNNFAEVPVTGTVSGRVWLDGDNDGIVDPSETGIAGVTIELSGPVTRTTTTDANGNYSFGNVPPGNYTVRQPAQPAGTVNGRTVPGSTGGTATAATTVPSAIASVPVTGANSTSTANNFGEVPAGAISGSVWADGDDDGVFDGNETGLPGVTLVLTGTDDLGRAVSVTVTSGPDGSYVFPGLRPGTYTITQPTQPAGTENGTTVPGSLGGTATPRTSTPSAIAGIVLPPGGLALRNDFAEVANSPDLKVNKSHAGAFSVGRQGTFTIRVANTGNLPSTGNYTVSDRLPAGMTLAATPTGSGWACVGAVGAGSFSCTSSTVVAAGAANPNPITAIVDVASTTSPVSNAVLVEGGGEISARGPTPQERDRFNGGGGDLPLCTPAPTQNACRDDIVVQQPASVAGTVWFDAGSSSRLLDGGDRRLSGWGIEVIDRSTGQVIARATTGADGTYRITDLAAGVPLAVRFRDPSSGIVFGYPVNGETAIGSSGAACVAGPPPVGVPSSCVSTGAQPQLEVVLASGQLLAQQSLPVDPSGVVYDSVARTPVPGAVVTIAPVGTCTGWNPTTGIVGAGLGGYTVSGSGVSMTVGREGFYQFLLAPTAPASCTFGLTVTPPSGYSFVSTAIPPQTGALVPPGAAGTTFNVQPQAGAPTGPVGTATQYWLQVTTGSAGANVVHNHIPLDPSLPGGIGLFKTGDRAQAEIGDSVRYSITVKVTSGALPQQTTVVDRLPAGFTYIRGTAMVDGVPIADPQGGVGPTLAFNLGPMPTSGQQVLQYRVRVGVGSQEGDGINRARGYACAVSAGCVTNTFDPVPGSVPTNESQYRVRVSGGVFGVEACFAGSLFVDCNHNHVKDPEEIGIPGVRLFLQDGTTIISDSEGKFSMCGLTPNSHVLKVDPITLPIGSRLTTTSNRNLGDGNSIWLDLKNGEMSRADFAEGSCSNRVLEQVKARRALGEVRAPEAEKGPALRFESKPITWPQQGTDSANQPVPKPRATDTTGGTDAKR